MSTPEQKNGQVKFSELKEAIFKSKKSFLFVGFFSLFINLLMLTSPLYMLQLYDRVLTSRSEETLIMLTSLVVLLFITAAILEIVRSRVLIRIGNKMDSLLSTRIFNSIFELANKSPGKASAQPLTDLSTIRQFMTGNGVFAFFDSPWIPIYIGVLFIFHPLYGYFAIFAAIILLIVTYINERTSKTKLAEANTYSQASNVYINANLRNSEVINAMGMSKNIKDRWLEKYYAFLNAQTDASDKSGVWANISKSLRMLFQSLMLGLGGYLAIKGEVTPGMMIAGSIIMGRALAPLDLLTASWKQFSGARMSYSRLDELLTDFPEKAKPMELPSPKGTLSLENIVVIPPNSEAPSIQNLSMNIEEGDILGIVGPSAAGKSSLARAMLGLWPLRLGTVRIDGADINHWDKEILGKHIGYLPQDIEIFEGTVSENIARFSEVVPEKVVEAAKQAGIHEMILKLEGGYDTLIGVGGSTLSGGQRQRIGLARALYDNPVLVVLDEPNSNLDEIGELALVHAINNLRAKGTTVILITHRPSVLQVTTKLAFMQEGKLHMYGPTQEVLAKLSANKQDNVSQTQNSRSSGQNKIPKISISKPGV